MSDPAFKNAVHSGSKVIDGAGVAATVVGLVVARSGFLLALNGWHAGTETRSGQAWRRPPGRGRVAAADDDRAGEH